VAGKKTVLYESHLTLGADAKEFLNIISTNNVSSLNAGQGQYSYILDVEGYVLDDVIIYKLTEGRFMMVVNAANEPKIKKWLNFVINEKMVSGLSPEIIDLRSKQAGKRQRVDIALQGPASTECLSSLGTDDVLSLKPFRFINTEVAGIDVILSRTGYTGSKAGFELYVHPEKAVKLWDAILDKGKSLGIKPCGLGARDSLRIEAGLPLYGHELAGRFNISPFEAGYGWAVKLDKGLFIGKSAMVTKMQSYDREVVRIEISGEKGVRPLRENDGIVNADGICVGWILSCAKVGNKQIALGYVQREKLDKEQNIGTYYLARSQGQRAKGKKESVSIGEQLGVDADGIVVSRFSRF